jgi:trehalose 6-phosphate phosphatase
LVRHRGIVDCVDHLPQISAASALFLDFDGTLADLAPCPRDACVSPRTLAALEALQQRLSGAVAIVSGRTIADLDRCLRPLRMSAAGMYGAELRVGDAACLRDPRLPKATAERIAALAAKLQRWSGVYPGLTVEHKPLALALHYRQAPQHAARCWHAAHDALQNLSGFAVRPGKMVVEIVPVSSNKGAAIDRLMAAAPFKGRVPLFAGDDTADEAAIDAVQALGGAGIRIVDGPSTPTCARFTVAIADTVRDWLVGSVAISERAR